MSIGRVGTKRLSQTLRASPERDQKRSTLLDEASVEFNRRGLSHASMARIARTMRMSRPALYYYVRDLDDLVVQCYRRSCDVMAADLQAAEHAGSGLDCLVAFVRRALDAGRRPTAVLSEIDYLAGEARRAISAAHAANVDRLRAIIRRGVADRSVRACDDEVIAQTLIGMIAWVPLSVDWVMGTQPGFRGRAVEALVELVVKGYARNRRFEFSSPIAIDAFLPTPPNAFDRPALAAAKIEQLLLTASRMFNRRGIDATSLDDIAGALGATKGAFYHHLHNKTELVVRCYRRALALYERFADAAAAGRNGLERGAIGLYLNIQAHTAGLSPLTQLVGVHALPPAARNEITARSRALQRRFEAFGEQGQADGSCRSSDFDALAQLGAGAFEWLPKWLPPEDPRAARQIADEIIGFLCRGIRAADRPARGAQRPHGVG
ncbi:MAG: TetR/AcrR family transcriptional regulator [Steroidobacteraceae bacterium]